MEAFEAFKPEFFSKRSRRERSRYAAQRGRVRPRDSLGKLTYADRWVGCPQPDILQYWYFFQNIGGSKKWRIFCKILGRFAIF